MTKYLADQGIPLSVSDNSGQLTQTMKQDLLDTVIENENGDEIKPLTLDIINGLWENMRQGNTFEEIRQGITSQGGDPSVLDTFVQALQNSY